MTATDLILLNGWGQQSSSFRFDLLSQDFEVIGELDVIATGANIENNINRTIKRQLSNLVLPPSVTQSIDPYKARVRPMMLFGDGTEYPLGVFLFSDASRSRSRFSSVTLADVGDGLFTTATLHDPLVILDVAFESPISVRPGTNVMDAIEALFERLSTWVPGLRWELPLVDTRIRGTEWFVRPPGSNLLSAMNDLAAMAGCYSLFCNNSGVYTTMLIPDIATDPDFAYDVGENVYEDSIVESDDLLAIPNRYIVVNTSLPEVPIHGRWDVPSEAPHSIFNRSRIVTQVYDVQGIEDNTEANATAKAMGERDASTFRWAYFDSSPNPLHDTFNLVSWLGEIYREQSWTLNLAPGGSHRHELRRVYDPTNDLSADDFWNIDNV